VTLTNPRTYGSAPFDVAVIHGGPGAGGEMAPVARALVPQWGVLEPLQTACSVAGQAEELGSLLGAHGALPITLVGFSWGAWLSCLVAAQYPRLVRKAILVGSGPFEERYVASLGETRMGRLSEAERAEFRSLVTALNDPMSAGKDARLQRLGALAAKSDAYDPLTEAPDLSERVGVRGALFQRVWKEAAALRRSGELLAAASRIRCPVVAIHGDYDPHPAEGVREPLSAVLERFRFILIARCGHKPWIERQARETFYRVLRKELAPS